MKIFSSAIVCYPVFGVAKFAHKVSRGKKRRRTRHLRFFPYPFEVKTTTLIEASRLDEEEFLVYCSRSDHGATYEGLATHLKEMGVTVEESYYGSVIGSVKLRLIPYERWALAHPRLAALSQGGASVVYEVVHSRLLRHPVPVPSVNVNQRWATLGPAEIARIRQVGFRKRKRYTSIVH